MSKLCIPEKVLEQHVIDLGKTGAGKSSVLRHVVEHLLHHKKRVCIVDPKGDWWGLKFSGDGKSAGYPVIAFGDFKDAKAADVPINAHSGKQVAELIASGNRPCVIGLRGWMPSALSRFWIDFSSTLFNSNANSGLYLVIDEVQNFAPKERLAGGDENLALHWTKRLMLEGRGLGIVMLMASQRPQNVHNTILTQCETLIAMRVIHEADRAATETWIKGAGDKAKGTEVLNSLAGMARGEAWVWSPEIGFGPERVKFPMFETFDSFAPPQQQKKISLADWSTVNLDEVIAKMASVIEEQRANDPKELKAEVARLKKDIQRRDAEAQRVKPAEVAKVEIKEVPVMTEKDFEVLNEIKNLETQVRAELERIAGRLRTSVEAFLQTIQPKILASLRPGKNIEHRTSNTQRPMRRSVAPVGATAGNGAHLAVGNRQPRPTGVEFNPNGELTGTQQKIIDTIAMLGIRGLTPNREMIARWLGIHPNGGRYGSDLAKLRADGVIEGCELTQEGRGCVLTHETGLEAIRTVLDGTQWNIIDQLAGGAIYDRESLAERLGIHPNGGRYGSDLARLRTMGLIPERGVIKLTEAAFLGSGLL